GPLALPPDRAEHCVPVRWLDELDAALDLFSATDREEVGIDGGLRRPTGLRAGDDAEPGEEAEHAVSELGGHGAVLEDDARPAVHERPGAVAPPQAGEQRLLVSGGKPPGVVGDALRVRRV